MPKYTFEYHDHVEILLKWFILRREIRLGQGTFDTSELMLLQVREHVDKMLIVFPSSFCTRLRFRKPHEIKFAVVGLGLRISRPRSSQLMLKSTRTCRTLDTTLQGIILLTWLIIVIMTWTLSVQLTHIAGATTRLWIPMRKSSRRMRALNVKNRWFNNELVKVIWDVRGSVNHWNAPKAVIAHDNNNITRHRLVCGSKLAITSVSLRSKALRSVKVFEWNKINYSFEGI